LDLAFMEQDCMSAEMVKQIAEPGAATWPGRGLAHEDLRAVNGKSGRFSARDHLSLAKHAGLAFSPMHKSVFSL
jgi:hypothetical protein